MTKGMGKEREKHHFKIDTSLYWKAIRIVSIKGLVKVLVSPGEVTSGQPLMEL